MSIAFVEMRQLLAVGSGIGIEIGPDDLTVTAVKVRPTGVRLLGAATISGFRERSAVTWGATFSDFAKRAGVEHLSATVLLPRRDVIVRFISLPGVPNRDIPSAIELQLDSLHPFPEEQAVYSWTRPGAGDQVMVAITRRDLLEKYASLFAEAGIKVAAFTFSGAVLYSAARLFSVPPPHGFLSLFENSEAVEAYGEGEGKPLFSAVFDVAAERAADLAAAELRLPAEEQLRDIRSLVPVPRATPQGFDLSRSVLAYAAALAGACPRLALPLNLLPEASRTANSRFHYIPPAVLAALVIGGVIALGAIQPVEDRKYMRALDVEIAKLQPAARKAAALDKAFADTRARTLLLDNFRRSSKEDLDALLEITRLLQPPAALQSIEMNRTSVVLNGNAEQAGELLKTLDNSPLFQGSEFTVPLTRSGRLDAFRIRAVRKGGAQ